VGQIRPRSQGPALGRTGPILEARTRRLYSTQESIDRAESDALEMAAGSGLKVSIVGQIGLAVREIMMNAVVHGNGCDPHKEVVVTISRTPDQLKIVIADEGQGFDPDLLPDPLSPEGLLKGSGRGVFLARALMDELLVQRDPAGWTTVTMAKVIDSAT
jgi:serine/threonine-protein kinase RsbW